MDPNSTLPTRFLDELRALGLAGADTHLLVAVSGGCDSVTLLHLLRFAAGAERPRLSAAHFDHAMRPDSARDAAWVRGLCRAWDVPLTTGRADAPPGSETQARAARLSFLHESARRAGADYVATAHHADDQAETVLFRVLRGTGLPGLAGIEPLSGDGIARPLLQFWRSEIEAHARAAGLRWRNDPTNRTLGPARNRLRHRMLPEAERMVSPAARRNLVRLASLAREAEAGWDAVLETMESQWHRDETGAIVLARGRFRDYHPALGSRLLRRLLRRFGIAPTRAGTTMALQFITDSPSGRTMELSGGVRLVTEYDQVRVTAGAVTPPDETLVIRDDPRPGAGSLRVGGRRFRVQWTRSAPAPPEGEGWDAAFDTRGLAFPLVVRGWCPGDRIRLPAGTRRLKKLFADRRVPGSDRVAIPVVADAAGIVLWVAGVARSTCSLPRPSQDALHLTILHG